MSFEHETESIHQGHLIIKLPLEIFRVFFPLFGLLQKPNRKQDFPKFLHVFFNGYLSLTAHERFLGRLFAFMVDRDVLPPISVAWSKGRINERMTQVVQLTKLFRSLAFLACVVCVRLLRYILSTPKGLSSHLAFS